jgi:glycosyltransferase involved in cell wall biosynthesis
MNRHYRIACLVTHPIQYHAPLFRYLAKDSRLELEVFFLSSMSLEPYYDSGFGARVEWDTRLLEGYKHSFLPAFGSNRLLTFWRPLTHGLRDALRRGRFDALWVHGYGHQGLLRGIATARRLGIKVLMRGDSQLQGFPRGANLLAAKRILLTRLFRTVDGCLAVGARNREYYRSYGVPAERIFMMPYAVDNASFQAAAAHAHPSRERLRASLGLPPGRPVILYASKFQTHKRPQDLLEAFIRLSPDGRAHPPAALLFVGDGEERPALERRISALDWSAIQILGFRNQSELPALFDLCDIFVLPSAVEPWGLVINEVMNAGKAIIASDRVGAVSDLVHDGLNGFVFPAGDIEALRERLGRLIANPMLTQQMGLASLRLIASHNFESDRAGLLEALEFLTATAPQAHPATVNARGFVLPQNVKSGT